MDPWKTLARRKILDCGDFLVVESHDVELPDGRVISDWPWVITPDYINVVAVTGSGQFLCFRQTKYAVDGETLALVGGYIENEEDPLVAAKRELLEETGHEARHWVSLGAYAVDGNRGAGTGYLYLATDAQQAGQITADDLEEQALLFLSRTEIKTAVLKGAFKILPNAAAVSMALLHPIAPGE